MSGTAPNTPRPRILLITRNLPPLIGGMERLVQNLACGISEWADLTVIGPRGCTAHLPPNVKTVETSEKLAGFLFFSTCSAVKLARQEKYHLVIGGSGLSAPILALLTRIFSINSAVLLHGLDLVVENRVYQRLFVPAIRAVNLVIANSRNTRELAINRRVNPRRIVVVNPGTTLPDLPEARELSELRKKLELPEGKIIIFVGRMTQRKGLSSFIRNCFPHILSKAPDTTLLVVGEDPAQSLNKLGEEGEVIAASQAPAVRNHIQFLGHISDTELTACYALADVQILPLIEVAGDVEGFGMIAVEAAACGTPTVAFDLGGVSDAIGQGNGHLIEPQNYANFASSVLDILTHKKDANQCRAHASGYAWPAYHSQIRTTLKPMLEFASGSSVRSEHED